MKRLVFVSVMLLPTAFFMVALGCIEAIIGGFGLWAFLFAPLVAALSVSMSIFMVKKHLI